MPLRGFGILWRPPGLLLKASVGILGPLCCKPRVPYVEWRVKYSPTCSGVLSELFWTFWNSLGPFWGFFGRVGRGEGPVGAFLGRSWALRGGPFDPVGLSWNLLRSFLGLFPSCRGSPGAVMGPCWEPLGPSWGPLEGLVGRLGAVSGAFWAVLDAARSKLRICQTCTFS